MAPILTYSLILILLLSPSSATNSTNQDLLVAIDEMQKANYFTFIFLLNMAPPNLIFSNITFLLPNDRILSKTTDPETSISDFLFLHSIPSPLLFDHLQHIPSGSLIPTSKPDFMLTVSNNGRHRVFLNNVRIISPNICTAGSSIRCHGIDGVVEATTAPHHNSTVLPSPTSCSKSTSPPPVPPFEPPIGVGVGLIPVAAPASSNSEKSGCSPKSSNRGLFKLASTLLKCGLMRRPFKIVVD
ncbi:hypothetical protein LguiA_031685 [Lonicera macranthoides]